MFSIVATSIKLIAEQSWPCRGYSQQIPDLAYERSSFLGMVPENTIGRKPLNTELIYVDAPVEAIRRRLLAGYGFAWMSETAISPELRSGAVVPIGGNDRIASMSITAYANPASFEDSARDRWTLL
jgi:LysR family transcriptional regulator, hypochlorite-specific transcription factor HypT